MAGEQFSYEEAFGAPQAAPAPPQAAFTDTGQAGTAAQQAFYRGLSHGTSDYATAPKGSRQNPVGLRSGDAAPAGAYYVDLAGHLHEPQDGAPQVAAPMPAPATSAPAASQSAPATGQDGSFSYDDAYAGAPTAPQADARPVSEGLGLEKGIMRPVTNVATWALPQRPSALLNPMEVFLQGLVALGNADVRKRSETAQPGKIGEVAGNVVGTLPAMALPGGPLLEGAASGALMSDNPNSALETGKSTILGAVGAKLGGALLGRLTKAAAPTVRPEVQTLINAGVPLTPGQIAGGMGQRMEDASTSLFGLGDAIKSAQRKSIEGFNRAAWNDALGEIGQSLPDKVNVGRGAAKHATEAFDNAYEAIKPQLSADLDQPFVQGVADVRQRIAPEALDSLPTFDRVFKDEILQRAAVSPNGTLDGQAAKDAQTAIGQEISKLQGSSEPKTQAVVTGLRGLQDQLNASLQRNSAPEAAQALSAINGGYAKFARLRAAAGYQGAKDGLFTPAQLSAAVRSADKSAGKGDFARGDALLQNLSDAGQAVLPSTVPDSGTAIRAFLGELPMLVGFGAESQHFLPQLAGAGIASGIPSLAYIGPGRKAMQLAMTKRPWTPAQAAELEQAVRPIVQDLGAVGGQSVARRLPQLPAR